MSDRLDREKLFHDERFSEDEDPRSGLAKYYSIFRLSNKYYKSQVKALCKDANLLELGCGLGGLAFEWAKSGAMVTGIDISDEGIRKAKNKAENNRLNVTFYQMNAEDMLFEPSSFDVVVGTGVIHHLNLENAYKELARVLRRDGHAIFVEPLGHNFIINLYRKLTPSLRTTDEHPLLMKDIRDAYNHFVSVEVEHFHLFTLLAVPFRRFFFFDALLNILHSADRNLMRLFPFLKRYSWVAIIHLHEPKK